MLKNKIFRHFVCIMLVAATLVIVPEESNVKAASEGDTATLNNPTEDGYIQWGDYSDHEDPTIIRFADDNYINFGLERGYWYWYWWGPKYLISPPRYPISPPRYPISPPRYPINFPSGEWRKEWRAHKERGYVEWDISSLAGKILTANPVFKYEGGRDYAYDEAIVAITGGQPSVVSDGSLFDYIASGTPYVDPFVVEGNQNESVDLGASARSDLQDAMDASQSWFAIGFKAREIGNMRLETQVMAEENVPTPPPTLYVEYTSANAAPTQIGESPTNGSTGISVTPDLYVLCLDDDADNMNATWWSNSTSSWVQFASNWTSFANNTNITQPFTNASAYDTTYYWSLNLTDGTDWCNETYHFTTASINTSVDTIIPYIVISSPLNVTATGVVDNVTLWYRYSIDNITWGCNVSYEIDFSTPWCWSFNFSNGTGYYEFYSIGNKSGFPNESVPSVADARCRYIPFVFVGYERSVVVWFSFSLFLFPFWFVWRRRRNRSGGFVA